MTVRESYMAVPEKVHTFWEKRMYLFGKTYIPFDMDPYSFFRKKDYFCGED